MSDGKNGHEPLDRLAIIETRLEYIADHIDRQNGKLDRLTEAVTNNTHTTRNMRYMATVLIGLLVAVVGGLALHLLGI